ncbi:hypothetical protein [Halorussus sp. MSC15.2]|uniref:hypothetical protein n=1 Tax=Halorussus sp. MSC15.2 TaxID=2283638 RepID=UPI0013D36BF3|nr:hypothetical protein [Halorussus sp. MSC15.2]NEU56731.1 hypothetical protein [Halorussus sp. MSC15.2]
MSEKNSQGINRRSILKSASAVAGLGVTGNVTAISSHGSTLFSELGIQHDVSLPTGEEYQYPFFHADEFGRTYFINDQQSKVFINETYSPKKVQAAKQNNAVVAGSRLVPLPTKRNPCQGETPITELREDYRPKEFLSVKEGYREPQPTVAEQGQAVTIEVDSERTLVHPGDQEILTLPKQEVRIEVYKTVEKNPGEITITGGEEWQESWRKPKQREYTTKTVSITPKVHVRNHGQLEVVGVKSKAPHHKPRG